ncbi:MAG: hypothetical protein ACRD8O_11075, partial [Bryobacteraceae bacterium]
MRFAIIFLPCLALAQTQIRPVPPPGVAVPERDRADLESGLATLGRSIDQLRGVELLADVQIFHNAVRYALT